MMELLHGMAAIPILGLLVFGRKLPERYWLLALAFLMSAVGDTISWAFGNSWGVNYAWVPIQIGLALWAFVAGLRARLMALWALVFALLASVYASAPGPDILLTVAGGIAVVAVARTRLAIPAWLYFGVGTVAYAVMVTHIGEEGFMATWWAYQGIRLAAYLAFVLVVVTCAHGDEPCFD